MSHDRDTLSVQELTVTVDDHRSEKRNAYSPPIFTVVCSTVLDCIPFPYHKSSSSSTTTDIKTTEAVLARPNTHVTP